MVEILNQGHLPENAKFICTCNHCKTEFSFKRSEATDASGADQRDHGLLKIACPLCRRDVYTTVSKGIPSDG